jgi:nucleoside-diphosphate-sugar epimerase
MTTLITGGSGFVGLALAEHLLAAGERVVVFDRAEPPTHLLSRLDRHALQLVLGDICSAADVDAALRMAGADRVVHAAAITPDAAREAHEPMSVVDVNIAGTVNLLQRCGLVAQSSQRRPQRILVVSSVAIYGIAPPAGDTYEEERSRPAPAALYGITKLAAEQAALRLGDLYALDVRIARLGPVFGPWEHATSVRDALSPHAQVLAAALAGEPVILPRSMRADWVYSRDAAVALAALAAEPGLHHAVYNVGGGVLTDLAQWCELLAGLLAARQPAWRWRYARSGETATVHYGLPVDRAALALDRLQADTFWSPTHSLAEAAADQMAWLIHPGPRVAAGAQTVEEARHGTA